MQAFTGGTSSPVASHSEGAAQLIKFRGRCKPHDLFERKLILALRGPVVRPRRAINLRSSDRYMQLFEGLYNERITLTREEWQGLIENELDGSTPEGQMMRYLAQMPYLMQ